MNCNKHAFSISIETLPSIVDIAMLIVFWVCAIYTDASRRMRPHFGVLGISVHFASFKCSYLVITWTTNENILCLLCYIFITIIGKFKDCACGSCRQAVYTRSVSFNEFMRARVYLC